MKKCVSFFFTLFSLGALSAQNLNFLDTNAIKTLLCCKHWARYNLNPDSSFSENISDSIVFNANGTFHKSAEHKISATPDFVHDPVFNGKWHLGTSGKVIANRSTTFYIYIILDISKNMAIKQRQLMLVDGYRLKGSKVGKMMGNIDNPFIAWWDIEKPSSFKKYEVWQARRDFKKVNKQ